MLIYTKLHAKSCYYLHLNSQLLKFSKVKHSICSHTSSFSLFFLLSQVCPKEAEALAVILGVVGGVLGVGLALLLIWKLLATIQV